MPLQHSIASRPIEDQLSSHELQIHNLPCLVDQSMEFDSALKMGSFSCLRIVGETLFTSSGSTNAFRAGVFDWQVPV